MTDIEQLFSILSIMAAVYAVWNGRKTKVDFAQQYSKMFSEATEQIEMWMEQVTKRDQMIVDMRNSHRRELAERDALILALQEDIVERDVVIRELRNWAKRLVAQVKKNGIEPVEMERRDG